MIGAKQLAENKRLAWSMGLLLCASTLAGCTATTIDTQGLQPIGASNLTTANLGLTDDTAVPTPDSRPTGTLKAAARSQTTSLSTDTGVAAPAAFVSADDQQAALSQLAQAPAPAAPGTQPLSDAAQDSATQRILQASNAPAGSAAAPAKVAGAATAPLGAELAQAPVPAAPGATAPSVTSPIIASAAVAPQAVAAPVAVATAPAAAAIAPAPRRTGIFRAMFNRERFSPPAPIKSEPTQVAAVEPAAKPASSVAATPERRVVTTVSASSSTLPGVSRERALGVSKPKANDRERIEVASAAGLARLAPNGLKTQHSGVDIKCLKPALVRLLKRVESHYGKSPIVTSGYRSPARNKRARGAKNSLHMYCAAADIQVPGVSKWKLASFLRSTPGRGGVGTYCHTKSVHIDIGPKRDWNARCRRR